MEKSNNLAVLILAAGTSSRLGEPKQLLKVGNETLIQIAVKKALKISSNVKVVLGHKNDEIKNEIIDFPISIMVNSNYKEGMGSSISYCIPYFLEFEKVLIMLCDQPLIPLNHYQKLIKKSSENKNLIICSKYQNRFAVPSIFPKIYFKMLENLKGDKGAKKFLEENPLDFVLLEDKYSIDIDTKKDYLNFLNT
ncbi:nucleotidyltransferase family protein [Poseidonibacter antarcticus]|uniref:nucleotidyltransferase family protein n=1 Tax=Poseidonibacter antarcticus TaxID=2478538 RepID=UPI000EF44578|nr:nucleotidyltransferase family protein [Poseidonibacter antarcticus]